MSARHAHSVKLHFANGSAIFIAPRAARVLLRRREARVLSKKPFELKMVAKICAWTEVSEGFHMMGRLLMQRITKP